MASTADLCTARSGLSSVQLERPEAKELCAIAKAESLDEWTRWEQAVLSCALGHVDGVLEALVKLGRSREVRTLLRRLSELEAAAFAAAHGVPVDAGQRLVDVARESGHLGLVELLSFSGFSGEAVDEADWKDATTDDLRGTDVGNGRCEAAEAADGAAAAAAAHLGILANFAAERAEAAEHARTHQTGSDDEDEDEGSSPGSATFGLRSPLREPSLRCASTAAAGALHTAPPPHDSTASRDGSAGLPTTAPALASWLRRWSGSHRSSRSSVGSTGSSRRGSLEPLNLEGLAQVGELRHGEAPTSGSMSGPDRSDPMQEKLRRVTEESQTVAGESPQSSRPGACSRDS